MAFWEPDAGRRPGVYIWYGDFLLFPCFKAVTVSLLHMVSNSAEQACYRRQAATQELGLREEGTQGSDSYRHRLSASPPAFGPPYPLSGWCPQFQRLSEGLWHEPQPASRLPALLCSFLSSAKSVTTGLTTFQLPKCCCSRCSVLFFFELSERPPPHLKKFLHSHFSPLWLLVTKSLCLMPPPVPWNPPPNSHFCIYTPASAHWGQKCKWAMLYCHLSSSHYQCPRL